MWTERFKCQFVVVYSGMITLLHQEKTSKHVWEKATPSLPYYRGSQPNIVWTTAPIEMHCNAVACSWTECKNLNNPLSITKIQSTPKSGGRECQKMHRHCLAIQTIIPTTSIPTQKENNTSLLLGELGRHCFNSQIPQLDWRTHLKLSKSFSWCKSFWKDIFGLKWRKKTICCLCGKKDDVDDND